MANQPDGSNSPTPIPLADPDSRLNDFYIWLEGAGGMVFFSVFVVASLLMIPKAMLLPAAGYYWGMLTGSILAFSAVFVASSVGFLITRKLGRKKLLSKFDESPRFQAVDQDFSKNGVYVIFFLRLAPIIPFGVSNYAFGLTGIRYIPYILASMLGLIPSVLIYLYSGCLLKNGVNDEPGWIGTASNGLLFVCIFGGLWILGRIVRRALRSIEPAPSSSQDPQT